MNSLVVGLGNPGPKYELNRHNLGFRLLDAVALSFRAGPWQEKFSGLTCRTRLDTRQVTLLKPMTYMNLSGQSVAPAARDSRVEVADIIVVHDDIDLPFGTLRVKRGGGTAGHNGLESIKKELGDPNFLRVRMGIGRPGPDDPLDVGDYVLNNFSIQEEASLIEIIAKSIRIVKSIVRSGAVAAMNHFNKRGGETDGS